MTDRLVPFFFESGQLSRVPRSGFTLVGVENPHTTAEHSHRASIIGYFLARLEDIDANKVLKMCLFHDIHETRLNDLHKVGHRYINFREAESKAHEEQLSSLGEAGSEILDLVKEVQARESPEALVARDADLLENALEAREYIIIGYKEAQNWIDNIRKVINTDSGKKLLDEIENADPYEWWKGLKKIER